MNLIVRDSFWLPELREGFRHLDRAVERVRESDGRGPLVISVAPAFAAKWLVPRLERLSAAYPDIDVRISARLTVIDFQRDAFDAAIRLGRGSYPGLESTKLFDESVTPMCSPRLLEGDYPLRTAADLHHHLLLHDDSLDFDLFRLLEMEHLARKAVTALRAVDSDAQWRAFQSVLHQARFR